MSFQKQIISYKYFDIVTAFFAAIFIISNIASSAKIVDLGFSLFGIRLAFDGGTLLFPLAYILGDILTEVYGFKAARRAIWTGFGVLTLSALVFFALRILPPEAVWEAQSGHADSAVTGTVAYNIILGGISSGGIVIASLSAYLIGGFSNSILLSKIKVLMKGRHYWIRSIGSSVAGHLLDSFVFISVATIAGVFPAELFATLILTNFILKFIIELLAYPVNYIMVRFLKKKEGIDVYDTGIKYRLVR